MDVTFIVVIVILIVLSLSNISLHGFGCYLLRCLSKDNGSVQNMFIMSLSAVTILINFFSLLTLSLRIESPPSNVTTVAYEIAYHLEVMDQTMLNFIFYMTYNYLALNKYLEVQLNIKYPIYCNNKAAKYLLTLTWSLGIIFFVTIELTEHYTDFEFSDVSKYYFISLDIIFVFIVIFSYAYIFHRYKQTRNCPNMAGTNESILNTFRKSRFYISVLLVFTFVVFYIIPDFIYVLVGAHTNDDEGEANVSGLVISFLYSISFTCDAIIYTFLKPNVRRLLWKKLRKFGVWKKLQRDDMNRESTSTRCHLTSEVSEPNPKLLLNREIISNSFK